MKLTSADYTLWATVFFLSVICFGIFTMVRTTSQASKNLQFGYLTGITVASTPANFTCQLNLTNPENYTIQVYSLCYSDPDQLAGYCNFESSVANGTEILPEQTVDVAVWVDVAPNPFSDGELYIKFYYVEKTT